MQEEISRSPSLRDNLAAPRGIQNPPSAPVLKETHFTKSTEVSVAEQDEHFPIKDTCFPRPHSLIWCPIHIAPPSSMPGFPHPQLTAGLSILSSHSSPTQTGRTFQWDDPAPAAAMSQRSHHSCFPFHRGRQIR